MSNDFTAPTLRGRTDAEQNAWLALMKLHETEGTELIHPLALKVLAFTIGSPAVLKLSEHRENYQRLSIEANYCAIMDIPYIHAIMFNYKTKIWRLEHSVDGFQWVNTNTKVTEVANLIGVLDEAYELTHRVIKEYMDSHPNLYLHRPLLRVTTK